MKKKQWHMKNEIDVSQADEAPAQKKIMNLELVAPMAPERMRVRSDDYETAQINVAMVGTMRQVFKWCRQVFFALVRQYVPLRFFSDCDIGSVLQVGQCILGARKAGA